MWRRALVAAGLLACMGALASCGAEAPPPEPTVADTVAAEASARADAAADSARRSALDTLAQAGDDASRNPSDAEQAAPEPASAERSASSPPLETPPLEAAPPIAADSLLAERLGALERKLDSLTALTAAALAAPGASDGDGEAAADSAGATSPVDAVGRVRDTAGRLGWQVFFALVVGVAAFYLIRFVTFVLDRLAARTAERRLFYKRLIPILRIGIWLFTAYIIIRSIFGLDGDDLIAAGAALGVAIGFAAQDALKNIFGGLIIVFDQPFQVGDKISVGGTYGEVVEIGLRSTRIVTPDDNLVSVPNAQVADGQVSNANAGALDCQVVTDLYLPGWADVHRAKQIAYEAAATSKYVYLDKPIVVICKDEFKETFLLHLKVKAYVLDTRFEFLLMSDVTEAAKAEFLRQGLLEPMPVRSFVVDRADDDRADDEAPMPAGDGAPPTA